MTLSTVDVSSILFVDVSGDFSIATFCKAIDKDVVGAVEVEVVDSDVDSFVVEGIVLVVVLIIESKDDEVKKRVEVSSSLFVIETGSVVVNECVKWLVLGGSKAHSHPEYF